MPAQRGYALRHDTRMESLRGKLLIASPAIADPNFRQTVVLLAEHTDEGAMGVILNREGAVTVGEAVPDLAYLADEDDVVHVGGPVSADVGHRARRLQRARTRRRCSSTSRSASCRRAPRTTTRSPPRCAARASSQATPDGGRDSSSPRWTRSPGSSRTPVEEDVFTADPDSLWSSVLRRKGGEYAVIATMPADPSLN